MRLDDVLLPGELEVLKQAYRQGYDWRAGLHATHPPADKDDAAHYARINEIADALEKHFAGLPQIVHYENRGNAPAPKGTTWLAERGHVLRRR
jgi:hypothetical protein